MESPEPKTEAFYADIAEVVGFARWMLQSHEPINETDRRILSDLRNVHLGLLKEASLARGVRPQLVTTSHELFQDEAAESGKASFEEQRILR